MKKTKLEKMNNMASKTCVACKELKPLDPGYYKDKRRKDGHQAECKVCQGIRRNENYAMKTGKVRKNRVFTRNEVNIFCLGVLEGEDRCRDLQKVITAQQVTIKALVEVMNSADERDAKRAIIPE